MMELDFEALQGVRDWALRRVDERERRERMQPLFDVMLGRTEKLVTETLPDLMAKPTADVRRSVLALAKSDEKGPQKLQQMDERLEDQLHRARRRTAALRVWLEVLS